MNTIAVTDRKTHSDSLVLAKAAAERLGIPFVDRKKASLADLRASYGVDNGLLVNAIQSNDYNVVISLSFIYSAMYIGIMLVVDLLYGIIDPRIRLAKGDD